MVGVLDHALVERSADGDVVEHREVLDVLAESDAAGVRADGHVERGGEQQHGDHLVDATEAAAVDLRGVDGAGLQQLLEHHPVVGVLAGHDADRGDGLADAGVGEDVVGAGRLLDPPRVDLGEGLHVVDGDVDVPHLVGVDHEPPVGADLGTDERGAAHVVVAVLPDLHLEGVPTLRDPGAALGPDLVVGVAQPAGRGDVGGVAVGEQMRPPLGPPGLGLLQQRQRLGRRDGIGDVAEVDGRDDLGRGEVGEERPQWLALAPGQQVPLRVDDGSGRQVHDTLLGAEPAVLTVGGEAGGDAAQVAAQFVERATDDEFGERVDRGAAQVVAPADGERHAVPGQVGIVGVQRDVGGRVVGVGVHGVGAVEQLRRREPDVVDGEVRDRDGRCGGRHQCLPRVNWGTRGCQHLQLFFQTWGR